MNSTSLFDFNVDKAAKKVFIDMEFDAGLPLVWDAFTKPEILDQWYAPKPMQSKTKYMHFKVGGRRFFAMVMPDGQERWSIQEYKSITPKTNFKMFNCFADKDENLQLPGSDWDLNFTDQGETTKVHITVYNESFERMESLLEGFKIGFAATIDQLRTLLQNLSK